MDELIRGYAAHHAHDLHRPAGRTNAMATTEERGAGNHISLFLFQHRVLELNAA